MCACRVGGYWWSMLLRPNHLPQAKVLPSKGRKSWFCHVLPWSHDLPSTIFCLLYNFDPFLNPYQIHYWILFQKYILSIVRPIFDAEFNSIEEFIKSNRRDNLYEIIIVKIMCTFEDPECQEFGEKILENWMNKIDDKIRNM